MTTLAPGALAAAPEAARQAPGYGEILRFALPLMLGMLTSALLSVVDAAFIGRLGTAQLAALGMANVYYYTWLVLFVGLMRNSIAFMAHAFGAGRPGQIGSIMAQYQWLALAGLPVLGLLLAGFRAVMERAGVPTEVAAHAEGYLAIRVWDIPFALTLILYSSLYQSLGNSRFPALVQLGTVMLNGPLDYALIFGMAGLPALGMPGAALATVLAQVAGAAVIVASAHLGPLRRRCGLRLIARPRPALMREILVIGVPQGLGDFVEVAAFLGFFLIVGRLGEDALAANNIGIQATHLLFMPGYAVAIAAASYMGRFLGARAPGAAARTTRRTLAMGMAYMAAMGLPLWFWGEPIAALFTADPAVIAQAGLVFKVMALYQVFDALGIITRGALGGAGDTLVPALLLAALALSLLYPASWALSRSVQPGVLGAWLGAALYVMALGLTMWLRFRQGAWRRVRLWTGT
jgi:MATE family multidrug resistance protein